LILALPRQVYRLRAVAALLQFGDELLPAPSAVKSPMHQQELCHEYPPSWPAVNMPVPFTVHNITSYR
jgi:hypothetical protein